MEDRLKIMKESLMACAQEQMNHLDCVDCECVDNCPQDINELNGLTFDLINRLQAENERLIKITRPLIAEIKAEAYTEFAELLCKIWQSFEDENICGISNQGLVKFVCKKMVGEDNAN